MDKKKQLAICLIILIDFIAAFLGFFSIQKNIQLTSSIHGSSSIQSLSIFSGGLSHSLRSEGMYTASSIDTHVMVIRIVAPMAIALGMITPIVIAILTTKKIKSDSDLSIIALGIFAGLALLALILGSITMSFNANLNDASWIDNQTITKPEPKHDRNHLRVIKIISMF